MSIVCLSFLTLPWQTIKFHVGLTKNQLFGDNSAFFSRLSSNAEVHEFVHFIKAFWVDFVKSLSEIQHGGSKMADQMPIFDVV